LFADVCLFAPSRSTALKIVILLYRAPDIPVGVTSCSAALKIVILLFHRAPDILEQFQNDLAQWYSIIERREAVWCVPPFPTAHKTVMHVYVLLQSSVFRTLLPAVVRSHPLQWNSWQSFTHVKSDALIASKILSVWVCQRCYSKKYFTNIHANKITLITCCAHPTWYWYRHLKYFFTHRVILRQLDPFTLNKGNKCKHNAVIY
jgi:hypothetical protein